MSTEIDVTQGKTIDDMGNEVLWFLLHTFFAILTLVLALAAMTATQPDPVSPLPKLIMTALAFLLPCIVGFLLARVRAGDIATHVWLAGVLFFGIMCVWVLDLPTPAGLCAQCTPFEKLWRTFFDATHGSGLLEGNGMLFGTWFPLAMVAYAVGAKFSVPTEE